MLNPPQLAAVCVEEIALEGMDGLTLESLWIRLAERLHLPLPFGPKVQQAIWHYIVHSPALEFYELTLGRPPIRTFDRTDFDTQAVEATDAYPFTVYAFREVDEPGGRRGSCQDYDTRRAIDASAELQSLRVGEAVERFTDRLVVAGTQGARDAVLIPDTVSVDTVLTLQQYCLLERIGRSRWNGETTNGRFPLDKYNQFHLRKPMIRIHLLAKQLYYEKVNEHNNQGLLLHLPRFFRMFKPKAMLIVERIVELIKQTADGRLEYVKALEQFDDEMLITVRKVFKSPLLQQFVSTETVPFRCVYPDASTEQWRSKNTGAERSVRCLQLRNAHLEVASMWTEPADAEDGSDGETNTDGIFDESELQLNAPLLNQAVQLLDAAGSSGMSQKILARRLGLPKLQIRMVVRNLNRAGITDKYLMDAGRQRTTIFILKRYRAQLNAEIERDIASTADITVGVDDVAEVAAELCARMPGDNLNMAGDLVRKLDEKVDAGEMQAMCQSELSTNADVSAAAAAIFASVKDEEDGVSVSSQSAAGEAIGGSPPFDAKPVDGADLPINGIQLELRQLDRLPGAGKLRRRSANYMTVRMAKRLHIIDQALRRHHIIEDIYKLYHLIHNVERRIGYGDEMCRRSVKRLVSQLCEDRKVRLWLVRLTFKTVSTVAMYISELNVEAQSPLMQRQLEKEKMKFLLRLNSERSKLRMREDGVGPVPDASTASARKKSAASTVTANGRKTAHATRKPAATLSYGNVPKFLRMRTLHEFLYYLVAGQSENAAPLPVDETINRWHQVQPLVDYEEIRTEMSQVYSADLDWRTFVPPLQQRQLHATSTERPPYTDGWVLFADAFLRMPLSVFVQLQNHNYVVPGLEEMLQHPVRKHYLLSFLPAALQNALLGNRRYLFQITEVLRRCCSLGLLQLGPQRAQNKEHIYIYVNRLASLADTTGSEPAYYKCTEAEYPRLAYHFDTTETVTCYWHDLHRICTSTKLNRRVHVQAPDRLMLIWDTAPAMVATWQSRTEEEVRAMDTGDVPGDGRGAGGLDASLFAHLHRNWTVGMYRKDIKAARKTAVSATATLTHMQMKRRLAERKAATQKAAGDNEQPTTANAELRATAGSSATATTTATATSPNRRLILTSKLKAKPKTGAANTTTEPQSIAKRSVVRVVQTRRKSVSTNPNLKRMRPMQYYDEVDQQALRRMVKLRVDWSRDEDNFLLLARAAHIILCPNYRRLTVSSVHVRDLLHWHCGSLNKTSRACQRRIVYMLKHPARAAQFHLSVQEAREMPEVRRRFGPQFYATLRAQLPNEEDFVRGLKIFYVDLVWLLLQNVHRLTAMSGPMSGPSAAQSASGGRKAGSRLAHLQRQQQQQQQLQRYSSTIPDTMLAFRSQFTSRPETYEHHRLRFAQPLDSRAIETITVGQLIHAACCCALDKTAWNIQLYGIYKTYTDAVLTDAMAKMRDEQLISANKLSVQTRYATRSLPLNSTPYHLSIKYSLQMLTAVPVDLMEDAWQALQELRDAAAATDGHRLRAYPVRRITGGYNLVLFELLHGLGGGDGSMTAESLSCTLEIPSPIIVFDSSHCTVNKSILERIKNRFLSIFDFVNNENATRLAASVAGISSASATATPQPQATNASVTEATTEPEETEPNDVRPAKRRRTVTISEQEHRTHEYHLGAVERLMKMDEDRFHFFCVLNACGRPTNRSRLTLSKTDRRCPFDCVLATENPVGTAIAIIERCAAKLPQLRVADQMHLRLLSGEFEVSVWNVLSVFDALLDGGGSGREAGADEAHHTVCDYGMPQIAGEILAERQQTLDLNVDEVRTAAPVVAPLPVPAVSKDQQSAAGHNDDDEDGDRVSKLHDYFFLNSTKVALNLSDGRKLDVDDAPKLAFLDSICEEHIWPLVAPDAAAVLASADIDAADADNRYANALLEHLLGYRDVGATAPQLLAVCSSFGGAESADDPDADHDRLSATLLRLERLRLVLKTGVVEYVYVHARLAKPWMITTYNLKRLQREGLVPMEAHVLRVDGDAMPPKTERQTADDAGSSGEETDTQQQHGGEAEGKLCRRTRKTRGIITSDAKAPDENQTPKDKPQMQLHVKPWLRVNGSLNRRCLDRWLATVLLHCISNAGVSLDQLARRFSLLLPTHVRDLCEYMRRLRWLRLVTLRQKPSGGGAFFWQPYEAPREVAATDLDAMDTVHVEVETDAIWKLIAFIGDKKYSAEFI